MYNDTTRGYVLTITASNGIQIPLTLQTTFTVTCWVKVPGSSTSGGCIWQFSGGSLQGLQYLYLSIENSQAGCYTGGTYSTAGTPFTIGTEWNFFALRWDGSAVNLYKNGSIISNQTVTTLTGFSTPQSMIVLIGNNNGTEYVSNFRIYPFALTPTQIASLYTYQLK